MPAPSRGLAWAPTWSAPADETSWRSAGLLSVLAWHERMLQLIERPEPSTAPLESYPPSRHETPWTQRI